METFIKNDGYLIWDKSEVVNINNTKIVKTPFAFEGKKEINGYIQMQKLPENKGFTYEFFRTKNLGSYNFVDQNSRLNGNRIHYNINTFNKKLYAKDTFNLVHPSQLPQTLVNKPKYNWRTTKAIFKSGPDNNRIVPNPCGEDSHLEWTLYFNSDFTDFLLVGNCVQNDIVVSTILPPDNGNSGGIGFLGNGYWSGIFVSGGGSNGSGSGGYNGSGGFYGGDPGGWYGGNGSGPNVNLVDPALVALAQQLGLNITEIIFLENNPDEVLKITNFLNSSIDLAEDNAKAKNHIQNRISDIDYNSFCVNHASTSSSNTVWWMDDLWLNDANNFNLDIDHEATSPTYEKLNSAEKALVVKYPRAAATIFLNISIARSTATLHYPSIHGALNDKTDAFRHSFFNAINIRDVLPENSGNSYSIVNAFATAHEADNPVLLALQGEMDLHNNDVGMLFGLTLGYFDYDSYVVSSLIAKMLAGEMVYLKPLDNLLSKPYDDNKDGIQDCPTCLNGIIQGTTIKVNSNL